jgi:nucleoid-associated protein EbfC
MSDDQDRPELVPADQVDPSPAGGEDPLGGMGLDLGSMMQMAQQMGAQMAEAQERLAATEVEGSAGGGLVRVVLNGHLHLLQVHIDPSAVDPDDAEMLGDLVVAAFSDAQHQVARLQAQADPLGGMGGMLGGMFGGG